MTPGRGVDRAAMTSLAESCAGRDSTDRYMQTLALLKVLCARMARAAATGNASPEAARGEQALTAAVAGLPQQASHWAETLGRYFHERQCLVGVVMICDIRRMLTEHDERMLEWCEYAELPVHVLLNKSDKLAFGARKKAFAAVQKELQPCAPWQ